MTRKGQEKPKSTNPFDDEAAEDDDNDDDCGSTSSNNGGGDVGEGKLSTPRNSGASTTRIAPLDFNVEYDKDSAPALQFNQIHSTATDSGAGGADADLIFSPLANALVEEFGGAMSHHHHHHHHHHHQRSNTSSWEDISPKDSTSLSETSPLLGGGGVANNSRIRGGGGGGTYSPNWNRPGSFTISSSSKRQPKWKDIMKEKINNNNKRRRQQRVLMELSAYRDDAEIGKDYYKMIRLENLGTAKSWLILLLPYLAVVFCIILESNNTLKMAQYGPISGSNACFNDAYHHDHYTYSVPTEPTPPDPCSYRYNASEDESMTTLTEQQVALLLKKNTIRNNHNNNNTTKGTAFESGIIATIPPAANTLFADATFVNLSMEAMSAIYRGEVLVSGLLFEREDDSSASAAAAAAATTKGKEHWSVVATSRSERLAVACHFLHPPEQEERIPTNTKSSAWTCNSPQIMEILFSMPGSAILSGNELRINILYSFIRQPADVSDSDYGRTFLYGTDKLYDLVEDVEPSNLNQDAVLLEIVQSSFYNISHTNPAALTIDVWGRLFTIVLTVGFVLFWLRRVGFLGFGSLSCSCDGEPDDIFEIRQALTLLESPWVSFPERWYILVMLISLVLIQGPLVVLMYFKPTLNTVMSLKTASDTLVGVGVNGVLFAYLCLFEGFGYHTARVARKWMHHQKQVAEIRRAASYVVGDKDGDNEEAILRHTATYFEMHGDTEGTASLINLRLCHDPFGDNWADFLLPKLVILVVGAASIWLTAYTRFHFTSGASRTVSQQSLQMANGIYLLSKMAHFAILILWLALIFRSCMATGKKLRREPFLATRAAQLAYRVLFAHVSLGFMTLALLFFVWLEGLLIKWRGGTNQIYEANDSGTSMDFWLEMIERVSQRFPYSGTAASIGFGRILFATVSILIAAYIFLPPKNLDIDEEQEQDGTDEKLSNPNREEKLRQRRDKRCVVSCLRNSHTWRVLPLPIERASAVEKMLSPKRFYQLDKSGKRDYQNLQDPGLVAIGKYVPVFCVELACWLLEASFQAYYSPKTVDWNDVTPGKMDLNSIGLRLESAILDEATNTQSIVATNISDQAEGEEDSIIVVAFRGSVDVANLRTDLKSGMVALPDQLIGYDKAPFRVSSTDVLIEDSDGWIWKTERIAESRQVSCFSPGVSSLDTECLPFDSRGKRGAASAVSMAVLSATPIARNTLPCVHEGFNEVYSVIRRKVIQAVLPVLQRQLAKALNRGKELRSFDCDEPLRLPKIFVTGHSLGGALAQLLALDLASNCELAIELTHLEESRNPATEVFQLPSTSTAINPSKSEMGTGKPQQSNSNERLYLQPPIAVYTFGQPRVGNRAFSRLYKQRVPHTFRVATEGDPITALPKVACAGIYKHAGLEVMLDEGTTGNTLVGPTVVETLFRFHNVRTDFTAHSTDKYRDCLESALAPHELQIYYRGHSGKNGVNVETGYGSVQIQATAELPDWMTQGRSALERS